MELKIIILKDFIWKKIQQKQIHKDDLTFIDYNRAGTGLIEIVTRPRSADEACAYVEKLREILLFLKSKWCKNEWRKFKNRC